MQSHVKTVTVCRFRFIKKQHGYVHNVFMHITKAVKLTR